MVNLDSFSNPKTSAIPMSSPMATASLALLALLIFFVYYTVLNPASKVPGPWYTKYTTIPLIYHDFQGTKRLWIHDLHQKYGTAVRLSPNEISFASASALKEIYISGGGFAKTKLYSLFKQEGHTNLFTALDMNDHKTKKKRLADRYTNSAVLRPEIRNLLHDRAEAFARECSKTSSADVYLYLHCFALDCVTGVLFDPHGTKSIEEGKDSEMVQRLSYHDSRRVLVLRYHYPRLEKLYQMIFTRPMKGGSLIDTYAWESARKKDHSSFTLAARLLQYPEVGMSQMVAECLDHIGAGIDTTGDTLCFLMYQLSLPQNAKKMDRLSKELRSEGQDAKLETLPYLGAIINEALRLWAPGTLPLPRYVPQGGKVIEGYYLPPRTIVSCQSFTIHRYNESVFYDSDVFMPERWLIEDGGDAERNRHFFAFGAGGRTCIGKFLALSEMRALIYSVYSQYRTRLADDMQASMEMSDQLMTSRPRDMVCKLTFEPIDI